MDGPRPTEVDSGMLATAGDNDCDSSGDDNRLLTSLENAGHVLLDGRAASLTDQLLVSADKIKAFVEMQNRTKV